MEIINENNLSISEFQDVNELNVEELDAVAGGGLIGAIGGFVGGFAVARISGASMADSLRTGTIVGAIGAAIPEP